MDNEFKALLRFEAEEVRCCDKIIYQLLLNVYVNGNRVVSQVCASGQKTLFEINTIRNRNIEMIKKGEFKV